MALRIQNWSLNVECNILKYVHGQTWESNHKLRPKTISFKCSELRVRKWRSKPIDALRALNESSNLLSSQTDIYKKIASVFPWVAWPCMPFWRSSPADFIWWSNSKTSRTTDRYRHKVHQSSRCCSRPVKWTCVCHDESCKAWLELTVLVRVPELPCFEIMAQRGDAHVQLELAGLSDKWLF